MAVLGRLTFLQQLPLLLKGTSDDDTPCPGYLYEEMAKISYESSSSCQCLLEYLLNRLQNNSCHVKLKVLKILLYLSSHGSDQIVQDLRRNTVYIQEAAAVSGPPDPLHGISLYQKVRSAGQELVGSLYTDPPVPRTSSMVPNKERCQPGMGSQVSRSQGFGYSQEKPNLGGEALLSGIHRAAIAMTQKVLVAAGSPSPCLRDQADETYKPVAMPLGERQAPPTGKAVPAAAHVFKGGHRIGLPGGGWDDSDSGHSSQDSLQDKSSRSLSSDAGSKTGSDGQSRSSHRESTETVERVEPAHPGDCLQEAQLVFTITRGQKVFLTQEEVQHFVRGCSLLNCEVVFEMLNRSLEDDNTCVRLRSMCAIASLMTSDLLSHDHMLAVVRNNLLKLSRGHSGPVKDKARKILLQFEALTQTSPKHGATLQSPTAPAPQTHNPLDLLTGVFPETGGENLLIPTSPTTASDPPIPTGCQNGSQQPTDGGGAAASEQGERAHSDTELTDDHHGRPSLFDGMELVTPVRRLGKDGIMPSEMPPDRTPVQTVSQERTSKPGGLSAFSFLNS